MARLKQTVRRSYNPGLAKDVQLDTAYDIYDRSGKEGGVEARDIPGGDHVPPRTVTAPAADGGANHDHDGIHDGIVDEGVGHSTSLPHSKKRKASVLSSPTPEPAVVPTSARMACRMQGASMIPGLPTELQNRLGELELMVQKVQALHGELRYLFHKSQTRFQLHGPERGLVAAPLDGKAEGIRKACNMLQGVEDNMEAQKRALGEVKKMLRLILEKGGDVH